MTLAFLLRAARDDDSFMLDGDTYRPERSPFHDWRWGRPDAPHPATCPNCGRKVEPTYVTPTFRVKHRSRDVTVTYDGYTLVSKRFRDHCLEAAYSGVLFLPLPADADFFVIGSDRVIAFDVERRRTRREKYCEVCHAFNTVAGATPVMLRDVTAPLLDGFYRTDIEFGSAHEQHPLMLVGTLTGQALKQAKFRNLELRPVTG